MGGAVEMLEKMEHAAHAGGGHGGGHDEGHGKGPGRGIGITMAIMGVLLALCAAMVGSERTELVKTMVEQSNTYNEYQAGSTKYRMLTSLLQNLYAVTPSRKATAAYEAKVDAMSVKPENAELAAMAKFNTKELVNLLTPRASEVKGFIETIARYNTERKAAKDWAESYDDEVTAHFHASEWYEKAQLASEIGIVIASIALLMSSRPFWYIAIASGIACATIIVYTFVSTRKMVSTVCDEKAAIQWHAPSAHGGHGEAPKPEPGVCLPGAEQKIHHARAIYEDLRNHKDENGKRRAELYDDELIAKVTERFGLEAAPAPAPAEHAPAEHAPAEHGKPAEHH